MSANELHTLIDDKEKFEEQLLMLPVEDKFEALRKEIGEENHTVLHIATTNDLTHILKLVIENVTEESLLELLMIQDGDGSTPVHYAAKANYTDHIQCVVESIPEEHLCEVFAMQNETGNTAVHWAVGNSNTEMLQCLLNSLPPNQIGELLNIQNNSGNTALHTAADSDSVEIINILLKSLKDPVELEKLLQAANEEGKTAIHYLAINNHCDIIKWMTSTLGKNMLKKLFSIRAKKGFTAVHCAAINDHTSIMRCVAETLPEYMLLELLSIKSDDDHTCAHYAAVCGHADIIKCITEKLPESMLSWLFRIQTRDGLTCFHYAAMEGHAEIVNCISNSLTAKALKEILTKKSRQGSTAMHLAAESDKKMVVNCILESLPRDETLEMISTCNHRLNTPFQLAAMNGHTETLKIMISFLSVENLLSLLDIGGLWSVTPLHIIAENGHALALEVIFCHLPVASLYDILTNKRDWRGNTAAHIAAEKGHVKVLEVIFKNLSSKETLQLLEITNNNEKTALDLAKIAKHTETVTFIRESQKKAEKAISECAANLGAKSTNKLTWPITDEVIVEKYLNESDVEIDMINLPLRPCTQPNTEDMYKCKEKYYQMTSPIRGRCLIINNRDFEAPSAPDQVKLDKRKGSDVDVANVLNVFTQLSFICEVHTNLTSQGMLHVLNREIQNTEHEGFGVSAFIIMTHGTENFLYGTDSRPVKLSDILDLMSPYAFKAMAGKPKIVVIQACSGDRPDNLGFFTEDSPSGSGATVSDIKQKSDPFPGDHLSTDDLFLLRASFLSFRSARHTRQGSWLIRALVCSLYNHSCDEDIETIFRKVKDIVRAKSIKASKKDIHLGGQQPTFECFPTKGRQLCLFPRFSPAQNE